MCFKCLASFVYANVSHCWVFERFERIKCIKTKLYFEISKTF